MTRIRHPAVDAVAALIRARPDVIDTDQGPVRIQQPCLLQMLIVHLHTASSRGTGAGGKGAGTMPLNTQAWDLLVEIRYNTHAWAELLGVDAAPYARQDTPRPGKPTTPPIGKLLRAAAVTASTTAREQVADAIARAAHRWVGQIEAMLTGEPEQRAIRGAACGSCGASTVLEDRGDGDVRVPAIVLVAVPDGAAGHDQPTLVCLACGWHGRVLDVFVGATPAWGSETRPDDHVVDVGAGEAA